MANYIKTLEAKVKELEAEKEQGQTAINNFRNFLRCSKFSGEENGERKDWISTADVQNHLDVIRNAFTGL